MSALEADLVEVKHDRDLARAEAERAAARLAAEAEATVPATTPDDHAPAKPAGAHQLQELAAMRKQRDGLLESTAQQRRELEQARAVSSQQAQQIREMDAVHKAAAAAQSPPARPARLAALPHAARAPAHLPRHGFGCPPALAGAVAALGDAHWYGDRRRRGRV